MYSPYPPSPQRSSGHIVNSAGEACSLPHATGYVSGFTVRTTGPDSRGGCASESASPTEGIALPKGDRFTGNGPAERSTSALARSSHGQHPPRAVHRRTAAAFATLFTLLAWQPSAVGHVARGVLQPGHISTVAGTGELVPGDDGPALEAAVGYLRSVKVDAAGNLLIADTEHDRVRTVTLSSDGSVPPPPDDRGNDRSRTKRMGLNSSLSGVIETTDDRDWFRLETSTPRDLRVRTTGGLDTVGALFDASGRVLATDDDSGDGFNFGVQAHVPPGVYYVRVRGFESDTGRYMIEEHGDSVSSTTPPTDVGSRAIWTSGSRIVLTANEGVCSH